MKTLILSLFIFTALLGIGYFKIVHDMVENREMLVCYNAGTFNECKMISRDRYMRSGYQDSFWIGCMNGLCMADGKGPTKQKSDKCNEQYIKVTEDEEGF